MTAIRAVSFDVGGTLIEPWPSVGHIYAEVALESGLPAADAAWLNQQFLSAWASKKSFDYTQSGWADLVVQTFNRPAQEVGVETPFFKKLYRRFTEARSWQVYDDVLPTLQSLHRRGLHLAVISNWDDRLRPLLKNLKMDGFFQTIEVSGECGHHKPAQEIFRRAASALNLAPESILHIGDSRSEDYDGARAAGFAAACLRRKRRTEEPGEIKSLAEVQSLI